MQRGELLKFAAVAIVAAVAGAGVLYFINKHNAPPQVDWAEQARMADADAQRERQEHPAEWAAERRTAAQQDALEEKRGREWEAHHPRPPRLTGMSIGITSRANSAREKGIRRHKERSTGRQLLKLPV
ncbi:MAG TPA: hypothetical protein VHX61_03455 [Rhizomicrobium sp.]|jgi:hypothetical protein|nr:hypothetical protein [Rhizomicrobium sp.]